MALLQCRECGLFSWIPVSRRHMFLRNPLQGVETEVCPEKSLPTRHTRVSQAGLLETASPRQTAYHTIVQPYGCADARVLRSHPSAVPLLVFANTRLGSDNGHYGAHGKVDGSDNPRLSLLTQDHRGFPQSLIFGDSCIADSAGHAPDHGPPKE